MTAALDAALPLLRCPVCGADLHRDARTVRCPAGHAFDLARQGHLSLLVGAHRHPGDTAAMVAARDTFLASGHYATIAAAVVRAVGAAPAGPVLDLAGGTGWYAARVLDSAPDRLGVTVDVSTPALQRAARAHPRLAAVGADAWARLPVCDGGFAVVLSVFGPRSAGEVARVLQSGAVVVAVTPTPAHLAEVVGPLGMLEVGGEKVERLRQAFDGFEFARGETVEHVARLTHADLAALVGMGPTGHHVSPADIATRVAALPPAVEVTVSVDVTVLRRA